MERSDRGRHGPRRRQRWSAPDHFHNSRVNGFQHYDGFKAPRFPPRPFYSDGKQHGYIPMPDELTLQHMSQDCSALKNHLLRLKSLLQLEDAAHAAEEEAEDNSSVLQLEELLKEVQVLREELRSRDTTIAQLTLQCQQLQQQQQQMPTQGHQVRCQCHHQRAPHRLHTSDQQKDKQKQQQYDKATQTYWRPPTHTPQILQPFSPCLKEQQQQHQGRLTRAASTAGRSDRTSAPDCVVRPPDRHTAVDPERLSHLLSAQLQWPEGPGGDGASPWGDTDGDGAVLKAQCEPQAPTAHAESSALTCPRVLQPPRLHKRVSLPALKPGGASGRPAWSRQLLPPPSRGLPCFNSGPQVSAPNVIRTSVLQPNRDLQSPEPSPKQLSQGKLRQPATLKIPIPASRSCLHKPKIS